MQLGLGQSGYRKLNHYSNLTNFCGFGRGGIIRFRGVGFLASNSLENCLRARMTNGRVFDQRNLRVWRFELGSVAGIGSTGGAPSPLVGGFEQRIYRATRLDGNLGKQITQLRRQL
jgi:hypothetical protein